MDSMFDEEPKARCPDCSQSLTFVRTRSHEKKWYCYGCEKYVDNQTGASQIKDNHARIEALSGLQVVDSHGILVGRVRKAIPTDGGEIKSLLLSVDKEQFKTMLDDRDLSRELKCPMIRLQLLVMWLFSPMCFLRVPWHHPSQLKRREGQDGVGSVVLS